MPDSKSRDLTGEANPAGSCHEYAQLLKNWDFCVFEEGTQKLRPKPE
jgi:hypothetical protein